MAVFTGARDWLVLPDHIAASAGSGSSGRRLEFTIYGNAFHSFTNRDVDALGDPRMGYDVTAHTFRGCRSLDC